MVAQVGEVESRYGRVFEWQQLQPSRASSCGRGDELGEAQGQHECLVRSVQCLSGMMAPLQSHWRVQAVSGSKVPRICVWSSGRLGDCVLDKTGRVRDVDAQMRKRQPEMARWPLMAFAETLLRVSRGEGGGSTAVGSAQRVVDRVQEEGAPGGEGQDKRV